MARDSGSGGGWPGVQRRATYRGSKQQQHAGFHPVQIFSSWSPKSLKKHLLINLIIIDHHENVAKMVMKLLCASLLLSSAAALPLFVNESAICDVDGMNLCAKPVRKFERLAKVSAARLGVALALGCYRVFK